MKHFAIVIATLILLTMLLFTDPSGFNKIKPRIVPTATATAAADPTILYVNGSSVEDFTAEVINGQKDLVVGVFVPGLFAFPIEQQPAGKPDFVTKKNNVLTEFSLSRDYESVGLLAHNYLSGSKFFGLKPGQDVILIYGDGRPVYYRVDGIESFQALKPKSPFSDFVDLSDPESGILSSATLFNHIFGKANRLVFQTCIDANGEESWGRVFIIANLVE